MTLPTSASVLSTANIGAFFDIDGTLLPAPSLEWRFAGYLLTHDKICGTNIIRWLAHHAATLLDASRTPFKANKCYLARVRAHAVLGTDHIPARRSRTESSAARTAEPRR